MYFPEIVTESASVHVAMNQWL